MRAHTHTYTQIYMSAWDVLTCPLGLSDMSSPPVAANSPFQPLTPPEAAALQWSTNDLSASVRPSPSHTFLTASITVSPSFTLPLLLIASLFKLCTSLPASA